VVHNNWQPPRKEHVQRQLEAAVDPYWQRDGAVDKKEAARTTDGSMD